MYTGYVGPTAEQLAKMNSREQLIDTSTWLTGISYIGLKVRKASNRPFKSGKKSIQLKLLFVTQTLNFGLSASLRMIQSLMLNKLNWRGYNVK